MNLRSLLCGLGTLLICCHAFVICVVFSRRRSNYSFVADYGTFAVATFHLFFATNKDFWMGVPAIVYGATALGVGVLRLDDYFSSGVLFGGDRSVSERFNGTSSYGSVTVESLALGDLSTEDDLLKTAFSVDLVSVVLHCLLLLQVALDTFVRPFVKGKDEHLPGTEPFERESELTITDKCAYVLLVSTYVECVLTLVAHDRKVAVWIFAEGARTICATGVFWMSRDEDSVSALLIAAFGLGIVVWDTARTIEGSVYWLDRTTYESLDDYWIEGTYKILVSQDHKSIFSLLNYGVHLSRYFFFLITCVAITNGFAKPGTLRNFNECLRGNTKNNDVRQETKR